MHERYRQTTDDRRQTDGRTTTYSEREHEFTFAKNRKYLHFNENKADIHNKAPTQWYVQPEPRCQHRKINVTSALSRVESELHQAEVTAVVRYQTSKKESPPTIRYSGGHDHQTAAVVTTAPLLHYCRRSSYADVKDETVTTPLVYRSRSVPPAHSRSPPFPEPRNAFHTR